MAEEVRRVNDFFRSAIKADVEEVKEKILLSDRQEEIFNRYYIRRQDVNLIADTLGVCSYVVNAELKTIRKKLIKII
ncbi:MAG: hypothetical protein IJT92_00910 [Spirochaetia bacterium]|nr:hypothetical protein [Spirochaetia bacterium]